MLRSRSSLHLLPITHSGSFTRRDSHTGLSLYRRRSGGNGTLQRVVVYIMVAALVGGSVYGAARVGRSGGGGGAVAAAGLDEFALSDSLLDNARVGGAALIEGGALGGGSGVGGLHGGLLRQQQQGRGQRARAQAEQHHLHDDVLDRRAALEQQHEAATAAGAGTEGLSAEEAEQQRLEAQHLAELRYLEAQHALAAQHAHGQQQEQRSEEQRKQAGAHGEHEPALTEHIAAHIAAQQALPRREGPSLYSANLSAVDTHGNVVHTADLMGHVTLIVNVASQCGYTESNYQALHRLYERYKPYGLEVVAFPCNQFGSQEPGSNQEIGAFVASRYGVQFPLMSKSLVNGPQAHPIYKWLKQHAPPLPGRLPGEDISWNFEKFLLDKYGHPVKRYASEMDYHDLEYMVYNELIRF